MVRRLRCCAVRVRFFCTLLVTMLATLARFARELPRSLALGCVLRLVQLALLLFGEHLWVSALE